MVLNSECVIILKFAAPDCASLILAETICVECLISTLSCSVQLPTFDTTFCQPAAVHCSTRFAAIINSKFFVVFARTNLYFGDR